MLRLSRENGALLISAERYALIFPPDRPFVYLEDACGNRLADLFIFSSVHPLHGRDDVTGVRSSPGDRPEAASAAGRLIFPWEWSEAPEEITLTLAVYSPVWSSKIYRFRCTPRRFTYEVEIEGEGQLCEVLYFGGYSSAQARWGSGFFWSGQRFRRGFNPEPKKLAGNYFAPGESETIDLMGVPLPGKDSWYFTPPPFCFALEGPERWAGVGVEVRPGAYRFTEYGYHGCQGSFHLSLSYEGHTSVHGRYRLPAIGFDFGADEYVVLAAHVQALQENSGPRRTVSREKPGWWYEPIFCGWGAQCHLALEDASPGGRVAGQEPDTSLAPAYSRQENYAQFLATLEANGLNPGTVVIDDKWQLTYGDNRVDERKWPDLPGFIQAQHDRGRKVLLWLKAWDPQGVSPEECITNSCGLPLAVDPTHPGFEARLRAAVRRMLSPDGYGADGFKIDFTARIPSGPGLCAHGDLWGLELMKHYLASLYKKAKEIKPEALVITHTPHPYLAEVVDMIRLNDASPFKNGEQELARRARVAAIACPEAILDTDNWPMEDRAAWRSYVEVQAEFGVPSLYYASHIDKTGEPLEAEDYALIREAWDRHRASIKSSLHGKNGKKSLERAEA